MNESSWAQVVDAAEATLQFAMTDEKMTAVNGIALNACANDLAAALRPDDDVYLCVAVLVDQGGDKPGPGMIALTEDRLLLATSKGVFRPTATVQPFDFSEIREVARGQRRARSLSPLSDVVSFQAGGRTYALIFYSAWMNDWPPQQVAAVIGGQAASAGSEG